MKKLLLTLVVSLALGGTIFAQNYESHWADFNSGPYETWDGIIAFFQIDGVYVEVTDNWAALEVASFVDGECRGHYFLFDDGDLYPLVELPVYRGETEIGKEVTFKLYDHAAGIEYTECTPNFPIVTGVDHLEIYWGDYDNAIVLNFIGGEEPPTPEPPTPGSSYWDLPTTWGDSIVPTGTPAVVTDTVIIRSGYAAFATEITMNPGSVIVIEPGGQLTFTSGEAYVNMHDTIVGWNTGTREDNSGYCLIASPVYDQTTPGKLPVEGTGLTTGNYDLYKFEQDPVLEENGARLEWINYNQGEGNPAGFESLNVGQGYLYANETDNKVIVFAGNVNPTVDTVMPLVYTDNADAVFRGFNLMGNPYTCNAYVINRDFYVLNEDGSGVMADATNRAIAPAEGFFVVAESADDFIAFSTSSSGHSVPGGGMGGGIGGDFKMLTLNLNDGRSLIDRAIVRFGEGRQLPKYQIGNCSKVYIPKDGSDYAIVRSEGMGEMPVNFKAEKNGAYTLNINSGSVNFAYLHLIDNLTGNDVDLLATPVYTFDARNTDYASRFKLVFATSDSDDENFAFFNNGNLIINNDGEATLQVVDVMGRILSSETVSGSCSKHINAAKGVYMIRLINGSDVKVQKIVVE